MNNFWIIPLLLAIIGLAFRYFSSRPILEGSMIALGLILYCFLPFAVFGGNLYSGGPGEHIWNLEFKYIFEMSNVVAAFVFLFVISFKFGQIIPGPALGKSLNRPMPPTTLKNFFFLLLFLNLFFAFRAREMIGVGYNIEYSPELMGPLATLNILITILLLNILEWRSKYSKTLVLAFKFFLFFNSILLLSMGGRMYVLVAIICFLLQKINNITNISFTKRLSLFLYIIFTILILAAIGVWRLGVDIDASSVIITAIAEPILTSISLASFFECGDIFLFDFPYNFLGSIVNLVPSILVPDKALWIPGLDPAGKCINSVFGATHIGSALIINFGVIGSAFFMIAFGWLLKSLRRVQKSGWWLHYYICSLLPFMFFRDGFVIFNKAFLTGILMSFVLLNFRIRLN